MPDVTRHSPSLLLLLALAACGSPDTPIGDECGAGKPACPTGFTCDPSTMRCVKSSTTPDAPPATVPDAAPATIDAPRLADAPPASTADAARPAALGLSPMSQSFTATVGGSSSPVEFTVTNSGGLESGPVAAEISDTASYLLTGAGCVGTRLAAGAHCTVSVQFRPTGDPGPRPATLAVSADPGGRATATLTATALAPSRVTVSPDSFSFGSVAVGSDSTEKTFTLQNGGGSPSGTLSIAIPGTTPFRITSNDCPATLAAGAMCSVGVRFKPTALGAAPEAALTVGDGLGGNATAALTGTGMATLTVEKLGTGDARIVSQPAGIDCGDACSASFTVSPVMLTASGATGTISWSESSCSGTTCSVSLAAAKTVNVTVTLTPAALTIVPTSAIFGSVALNAMSSPADFLVTNDGGQTTGAIQMSTNDPEFEVLGGSCVGAMLVGGDSCMMSVVFSPTGSPGGRNATLQVFADPGDLASAVLSGTAVCRAYLESCVEDANCCSQLYCETRVGQCWSIIQ